MAAKALGTGAWALLCSFEEVHQLDGGYVPEGAGKPWTESAMNLFGNMFAPPKLVLRQWWLSKKWMLDWNSVVCSHLEAR